MKDIHIENSCEKHLRSRTVRWKTTSTFQLNCSTSIMIFAFVKFHLKFLGLLDQPKSNLRHEILVYVRNCLVFISLGFFTVPTFCFLLIEAVTFADYVNSFFFTSCGLLGVAFNAILLWEKTNISQLIADLEDTFTKRRNNSFVPFNYSFEILFQIFKLNLV